MEKGIYRKTLKPRAAKWALILHQEYSFFSISPPQILEN